MRAESFSPTRILPGIDRSLSITLTPRDSKLLNKPSRTIKKKWIDQLKKIWQPLWLKMSGPHITNRFESLLGDDGRICAFCNFLKFFVSILLLMIALTFSIEIIPLGSVLWDKIWKWDIDVNRMEDQVPQFLDQALIFCQDRAFFWRWFRNVDNIRILDWFQWSKKSKDTINHYELKLVSEENWYRFNIGISGAKLMTAWISSGSIAREDTVSNVVQIIPDDLHQNSLSQKYIFPLFIH